MIEFILNDKPVKTTQPPGSTLLDYIRYAKRLTGTKIGCREGDCGACTILVGDIQNNQLVYKSMTSCLMPLTNAQNKHIVTVEGINMNKLSPVQQSMVDSNGTQCGFCTIGFVMSLTGFVLNAKKNNYNDALESIDGNICRCTGYKSIERAAAAIANKIKSKPNNNTITWLVKNEFIPAYFLDIKEQLLAMQMSTQVQYLNNLTPHKQLHIAGGTDLIVQKPSLIKHSQVKPLYDLANLKEIKFEDGRCFVGGAVTVTDFVNSKIIQDFFPDIKKHIKLISSTPIRNMATMAGNLVNASPIGDMSIFFLALNSELVLSDNNKTRTIFLKDFYKGYKQLDKSPEEIVEKIIFTPPQKNNFNFEKVSKRTHLDIASVNTAFSMFQLPDGLVEEIHISAGGVFAYPKYLSNTSSFLKGKKINTENLQAAIKTMNNEIAPISDARGTEAYKRLLLRQLFLAHFKNKLNSIKEVIYMQ